jgi:hypothetical protein
VEPTAFPVNDFGPAMRGMVIGAVGILHVFLAQFAIGGGFVLTYFQWMAGKGVPHSRTFLDSFFKYLVLINETAGADWLDPDWFRFGASSLLNDLLMQRTKLTTGHYAGPDYFTLD